MRDRRVFLLGAVAFLVALSAGAQPQLTGAIAFEADSSGGITTGYWNTLGGDGVWNLYVIQGPPGGAFVNSGNGAGTSISISLPPGTYAFTMQGDHFQTSPYRGLNLFFNGDNTDPKISVFEAIGVTGGQADGSTTRQLSGAPIAGAGTLVANVGGYRVRLSGFAVQTSVGGSDRVSDFSSAPNQVNDDIITFTLTVDPAPIPALGAAGLAALAVLLAAAGLTLLRRSA